MFKRQNKTELHPSTNVVGFEFFGCLEFLWRLKFGVWSFSPA
jgi:hypothetical protein